MKLIEGEVNQTYLVTEVQIEERLTRRLEALGVNEQTKIAVLNKKGSGSLIIKVRGTRLALGRQIAEGITVREIKTGEIKDGGIKDGGMKAGGTKAAERKRGKTERMETAGSREAVRG